MTIPRAQVDATAFNANAALPFDLRSKDFEMAMQDVYDFFFDVNQFLSRKGLKRLDDMLRPATMSGIVSDMLTESLAKHSRSLVVNAYHNGHPDLVLRGAYPKDTVKSGTEGVEIKATRKAGGAVDTHGARDQCMCVFVYRVDGATEPVSARAPTAFSEVYIGNVSSGDFRKNARGELGTRTATLHAAGIAALRANWVYRLKAG